MKASKFAWAVLAVFVAGMAVFCPLRELARPDGAGDFMLRYNETLCVRSGIDPFDVWTHAVQADGFHGLLDEAPNAASRRVHAYPAWAYTYFLPLSFLPSQVAYRVFVVLEIAALAFAMSGVFKMGRGAVANAGGNGGTLAGALAVVSFCACGGGFNSAWITGNWSWLVLSALMGMAWALNRGRDVLAGVCLGFAMTKPQMAALFTIPLMVGGKWKTLAAGAAVCVAALAWPAARLGVSPVDLVLEIPRIGAWYVNETLLLPGPLFRAAGNGVVASAALGAALCFAVSMAFAKPGNGWFVRMLPAALLSPAWTYCLGQDTILFAWGNVVLFALFHEVRPARKQALAFLAAFLMASSYLKAFGSHSLFAKLPFLDPARAAGAIDQAVQWMKRAGIALALFLAWRETSAMHNRTIIPARGTPQDNGWEKPMRRTASARSW